MSTPPEYSDPEKGVERTAVGDSKVFADGKQSLTGRRASVVESIVAADLLDERYATTQRGLKSRHAQMIAFGGTIGTGFVPTNV